MLLHCVFKLLALVRIEIESFVAFRDRTYRITFSMMAIFLCRDMYDVVGSQRMISSEMYGSKSLHKTKDSSIT